MSQFDLVREPWIPCLRLADGRLEELGLLATLLRAHELREISDASPLVTVTLHRLLLAVLHRALGGPRSIEEWRALWSRGRFDSAPIEAYFQRWHDRFDLFHPERPFYQTATLPERSAQAVSKLTPEVASPGNAVLLFDHTVDPALAPAEAARALVAFHAFTVGGLVSFLPGEQHHRSADAGPLSRTAVGLVRGASLFHTLLLNLHQYDPEDAVPCPSRPDDCPAWERDEPTVPADRSPRGYLDYLTWQSRRVRLFPAVTDDGQVLVRSVAVMKGFQFPDGFERRSAETMVAFVKNPKARPGEDPWPPVGFREDRALWRESLALFQSLADRRQRPKMLTWLNELVAAGCLKRSDVLPLDLFGMVTDQANVRLWRHERLPLPLAYLEDGELVRLLGDALKLAEDTERELSSVVRLLARLIEAPESDRPGTRQPDRDAVRARAQSLGVEPRYWSRLDPSYHGLLVALPADRLETPAGPTYGQRTLPAWALEVRRAALAAFAAATDGLASAPRTVKAVARAENALRFALQQVHQPYLEQAQFSSTQMEVPA